MSEQNYSIDKDLNEAQTMAAALVPYIYEDELYGHVGSNIPSLTPGAVLMRVRRLRALRDQLNATQAETFKQIEQRVEAVKDEWGVHYQKKLAREVDARLRDIHTYIRECQEDPRSSANAYMVEALRRTLIQEALSDMGEAELHSSGLATKVKAADSQLRRYVEPSDFIWDAQLQPIYPKETYWWLYTRAHRPDKK